MEQDGRQLAQKLCVRLTSAKTAHVESVMTKQAIGVDAEDLFALCTPSSWLWNNRTFAVLDSIKKLLLIVYQKMGSQNARNYSTSNSQKEW